MNVREAIEIISSYIDVLYNQGVLFDNEIQELSDAEDAIYEFLNAIEV